MVDRFQISLLFFWEGGLKLLQIMVKQYIYTVLDDIENNIESFQIMLISLHIAYLMRRSKSTDKIFFNDLLKWFKWIFKNVISSQIQLALDWYITHPLTIIIHSLMRISLTN